MSPIAGSSSSSSTSASSSLSSSSSPSLASAGLFNAQRARSYIFRLPLFTRGVVVAIAAFWVLGVVFYILDVFDLQAWGGLDPDRLSLGSLHRLTTFPFIHLNFFHALMNILALTPLMERFESEHGTLMSLALFFGPLTTVPAVMYIIIEKVILQSDMAVMGASIWIFLLLGMEAIRTFRMNPYLVVGTHNIPTWTTPLIVVLSFAALVPNTSLVGHLCGLSVGYLCGLGYLKYIAPPEKALRFIESKLNLLGRLPHYVSVDQKTYGRFGVLPSSNVAGGSSSIALGLRGTGPNGQKLGGAAL